jgi:hypothetical protein
VWGGPHTGGLCPPSASGREADLERMPREVAHLVLLKLQRPFDAEALAHIHSLRSVAGVKSISCGDNYTTRGCGYNYAITVVFDSKASEAAYQTHPLHVEVRDKTIKPALDPGASSPVCAVDYEYDKPECPFGWRSFFTAGFGAGVLAGIVLARSRL